MRGSHKSALRLTTCEGVRSTIEASSCDTCQAFCWHVEVWGIDVAGTGERICLFYAGHQREQSGAVRMLGRWLLAVGAELLKMDTDRWFLEHQRTLF